MKRPGRTLLIVPLLAAGFPALVPGASAQEVTIESRAIEIGITGRVHTQFNTTSVADEVSSEFLIRRARLTAELVINDWITGKVQPDYGEGEISLKDAYARLTFSPAFRATIGQFKRPFDLFELTSSTQILVIERAGGIRGVGTCAGVGGLCSFSRLTERLEYSDRDIGLMIDGETKNGRIAYMASVTNGSGSNSEEEEGKKSLSGRVELAAAQDLKIAGNLALHDYLDGVSDDNDYAFAYGADVEYGNYTSGIHLQAGVTAGDNWQVLDATSGDPATFVAFQGIVTYRSPITGNRFVEAIEPVGRLSWGNPDTDADIDVGKGLLLTPGFVVHFVGRNKVALNIDFWSPDEGDSEWSLKAQSYLHW